MPRKPDYEAILRVTDEARSVQTLFPALSKVFVGGEGPDVAEAFIFGDAPGAQDEIKGRPFAGQFSVLHELMSLAGLHTFDIESDNVSKPANAWLTYLCKFRPPGNRAPSNAEVKAFRKVLVDEWESVGAPQLIIPIGGIALSALFGKPMSIYKASGHCHKLRSQSSGKMLYIYPMLHPAIGQKVEVLQDVIELQWLSLGEWRKRNASG